MTICGLIYVTPLQVFLWVLWLQTDVVVSSIGTDLKLGVGPLSKAVLQKAGPMLQAEFDQAIQSQGAQGSCVIQTGGYNLACSIVLHAIIPQWDAGKGPAIQVIASYPWPH